MYVALDIETSGLLSDNADEPLPDIYCVATQLFQCVNPDNGSFAYPESIRVWHNNDCMKVSDIEDLIDYLWDLHESRSAKVVSWNGTKFDFQVMCLHLDKDSAHRSKLKTLCWNHIDFCFNFLVHNGFPVAMQKVAEGFGCGVSKSGDGGQVGTLWNPENKSNIETNRNYVISYCSQDLLVLQVVFSQILCHKAVVWITRNNTIRSWLPIPLDHHLLTDTVEASSKHKIKVLKPFGNKAQQFVQPSMHECVGWLL